MRSYSYDKGGPSGEPNTIRASLARLPTYRLHDLEGDDLGLLEHPAPNVEPGDVVVLADGREAAKPVTTARTTTCLAPFGSTTTTQPAPP